MSSQLVNNLVVMGSAYASTFQDSLETDLHERLLASHEAYAPNRCVLFVADDYLKDFKAFASIASAHDGYLLLIVRNREEKTTWLAAAKNPARVFVCISPASSAAAQEFVENSVNAIEVLEKLKSAQMYF